MDLEYIYIYIYYIYVSILANSETFFRHGRMGLFCIISLKGIVPDWWKKKKIDEKKEHQLLYDLLLFVYWSSRGRIVFPKKLVLELDLCDLSSCWKKARGGSGKKKNIYIYIYTCQQVIMEHGLGDAFDPIWQYVS